WNVARSPADIQATMNTGLSGNEVGLVGLWRLDEGTGISAADASGHGNVGILGGSPVKQPARVPVNTAPPVTTSLLFDGVDDLVHVGSLGARPTQGSIAFWINATSVDDFRNILTTGPLPQFSYAGNQSIRFEENSAGSLLAVVGSDTAASSGFTGH